MMEDNSFSASLFRSCCVGDEQQRGRTNTSQNSAVLVIDYGKGSVSVGMRGLQKSDAGWYWFSAGDVGVTVHLTVTERPSKETTCSGTEKPKESQQFCLSHN
ncbi:uncharacterized protein LOC108415015 isoform X2 [Pygocentrus nattereri]|uniref:uncharacterized protein LOC108415015 isoform X2 n=1 Tax=Pygocentrus nattereri TaxID=42514 RepID=UPI00081454BC|nr:uncharacterized protein LOC108415015 isoform X2 [Pygocentrus nattereri]